MDLNLKSTGFALSGGGTKGLAHAGAIKFLEEQNIKPSQIAGSSAGAIVAALYAWGKTPDEILAFFKSIYFFHWKHFTLKKAGIIDSESFKKYFEEIFKDAKITDLKIPIHITATDMVKGKLKIFNDDTKIVDAVLASSAVPGVISPYEINGVLYSDGGILNHFPTDILQGRCDNIIGVYVSPIQKIEAKDLKSIKAVTTRAFELLAANSNLQKFNNCDIIIEPEELTSFNTFETNKSKMDKIFEIGYQAAKKSFETLEA
ncbi:patatin-like phospholipase family protein [Flavobacterium aquatile]|jgi:NTE family protein|uniref:Patatin n=1 Tax=Flavobacterium aquatile LMG 4008 = ATCC 11947 TaxID=1453498 RepID=A0A095SSB0_9FLAO|nr:patatin-like phospholipase family protein [Flavobacterium aquatile]KGD67244.1 patatin [Flavobacterium aquatile LMG 4008 = ATCC 11947]OXA66605.1 patatin [Flavobacterium aquatile] [Flavobacterium aquatile LMG 4008 = ATCC 11947]GEC78585.1 phospholipase [Flavobacterium aquatile]